MSGNWYYSDKREQKGPVPFADLRGLAQSGTIRPTDLVWQEGTPDWVRASLVDGLFDVSSVGAGSESEAWDEPGPRPRRREESGRGDRRGGDRDYDRDIDLDRPRRRQPMRREEGMSSGLKIGLIVGGVALLLIVVAVILILVLAGGGSSNSYTVTLFNGQSNQRNVSIQAGRAVDVRVTTTLLDGIHADVDCQVFEPGNMLPIGADFFPGKDCNVRFNARRSGMYRVVVRNLGPGRASAHVQIRN